MQVRRIIITREFMSMFGHSGNPGDPEIIITRVEFYDHETLEYKFIIPKNLLDTMSYLEMQLEIAKQQYIKMIQKENNEKLTFEIPS